MDILKYMNIPIVDINYLMKQGRTIIVISSEVLSLKYFFSTFIH